MKGNKDMKQAIYVEYKENKVCTDDIIKKIKEDWVNKGLKVKDIKTLNIYVKPEDEMIYYKLNDEEFKMPM